MTESLHLSIAFLIDLMLRGTAIMAMALIAALSMRNRSAAQRHLLLSIGVISLLALPMLMKLLPSWQAMPASMSFQPLAFVQQSVVEPSTSAEGANHSEAVIASAAAHRFTLNWKDCLMLAWLGGVAICLLPLPLGIWRLHRLTRSCRDLGEDVNWKRLLNRAKRDMQINRNIVLLAGGDRVMPMTFGIVRPVVVVPTEANEWPDSRRLAVLMHELAHIKRMDCLTSFLCRIARAIHWPNPLIWIAMARIDIERERACDDAVLRVGTRPSQYAEELLAVGSQMPALRFALSCAPVMPMAKPSRLARRITQVLNEHPRTGANRRQAMLLAALAILLLVPLAALKADPATAPSDADKAKVPATKELLTTLGSRMREMDLHLFIYANDHRGQFPHQLGDVVSKRVKPEIFCTPDDLAANPPPNPLTADWVNQHSSWTYLAGDTKLSGIKGAAPAETVVLHSSLEHPFHLPTGADEIWTAYADGHAELLRIDVAKAAIEKSKTTLDAARDAASTQPAK